MCLGRSAAECVCDEHPTPVATCQGCGAMTDDAFLFDVEARLCPACLAREHEAGCTCPACVAAIERYWQVEAERPLSLGAVPDGEAF